MSHLSFSSLFSLLAVVFLTNATALGQTVVDAQLSMQKIATLRSSGERPVCLDELPNGNLVYSNLDGDIFEVANGSSQFMYTAGHHKLPYVSHMEVMGDYMYLCGSVVQPDGNKMVGYVMEGQLSTRTWRVLAQSEPYFLGRSFNDHRFSSLLIGPNRAYVYVHSGSRTNSGEVHELDGVPATEGLRWEAIRGKLFKLSTQEDIPIYIPNDSTLLEESGLVHVEGLRHLFAMAWGTDGNFYGGSNSDRRDVAEAFYQIMPGRHYGFPWWIGGEENPIQFDTYDPTVDRLLPSGANNQGYYDNDPAFPPMPDGIDFVQPYHNVGPDADKVRSATTGQVIDVSDAGGTLTSFSGHRSPVGLIFDTEQVLPAPFTGDGFMVSYSNNSRLLNDDGHDLIQLTLLNGDTLSARTLVSDFIHPIDVMISNEKLYVLEMGNRNGSGRAIYEIELNAATNTAALLDAQDLILYPNPTKEGVHLVLRPHLGPDRQVRHVRVYTSQGQQIRHFSSLPAYIDLTQLPPQMYLLEVQFQNGQKMLKKLLKSN